MYAQLEHKEDEELFFYRIIFYENKVWDNSGYALQDHFVTQPQNFTTYEAEKTTRALKIKMAMLKQAFSKTMATFDFANMFDNDDSSNDKDDTMTSN